MVSSKCLFLACLAAVGVASVVSSEVFELTEAQLSDPMSINIEDLPFNKSSPEYEYIKEISQISLRQAGLNDTICPCSILDSLVPSAIYLVDILLVLVQAILANLLNLNGICITVSTLFNALHPTPLGWNCCSDCTYCYLPNTTIFILVQIVVLGITIVIKLHN